MRVSSLLAVAILVAGGFAGNLLHRQERVAVDRVTSKKRSDNTKTPLTLLARVIIYYITDGVEAVERQEFEGQARSVEVGEARWEEAVKVRSVEALEGRSVEAVERQERLVKAVERQERSVEAVEGQARSLEGVHWEDVYTSITAYSTVVSRITHLTLMVPHSLHLIFSGTVTCKKPKTYLCSVQWVSKKVGWYLVSAAWLHLRGLPGLGSLPDVRSEVTEVTFGAGGE